MSGGRFVVGVTDAGQVVGFDDEDPDARWFCVKDEVWQARGSVQVGRVYSRHESQLSMAVELAELHAVEEVLES